MNHLPNQEQPNNKQNNIKTDQDQHTTLPTLLHHLHFASSKTRSKAAYKALYNPEHSRGRVAADSNTGWPKYTEMNNRKSIAERKYDGTYASPHIEDRAIMGGRSLGSSEAHPMSSVSVPMQAGREPSSRISAITSSDLYEDNPWAESNRRMTLTLPQDTHGTSRRGHKNDDSRLSYQGPFTDLNGPHGTSGKDPRRMDGSKFIFQE